MLHSAGKEATLSGSVRLLTYLAQRSLQIISRYDESYGSLITLRGVRSSSLSVLPKR
jgi:hypothetical protein